MTINQRRYPVGIQTFERIINEHYVYVDKTDLVWQLANYGTYIFLSRPRRFGKSLLTSTFHSYFRGDKHLFEGLKIMELEKEWNSYPVIHLDLSTAKNKRSAEDLRKTLSFILNPLKNQFNIENPDLSPGQLLVELITRAYEQTGKQVVVIIDEYDAPLLDVLHEEELLSDFRTTMQEFYQPLKALERMVKFCFITGITKFSQLSIFSTINNLKNVSMLPQFSAICGITDNEVKEVFKEDIEAFAEEEECTPDEMYQRIKQHYDGYHFASKSEDIYNPFSLLNAFQDQMLENYWFSSGTPTFLIRQMINFGTDITKMDEIEVPSSSFDRPTEAMTDALPLLYQSGYLTIKGYEKDLKSFNLAIPNEEVRIGFTEGLLPLYVGLDAGNVQIGFAAKFWRALKKHDIDLAMRELQAYLEGIPYVEGFKKKLDDAATAEGFYEYTLYLIFSMLNVYAQTQVRCRGGRIDMVVLMPDTTYVFEFKTNGTAQEALAQIDNRGYALSYNTENRNVVKVGAHFDIKSRTLQDWIIS